MAHPPLRVLFCIGINQNFFDLPRDGVTAGDVWSAFVEMMDGIKALPGVDFIGDIDDDSHLVGPSDSWPWTCYLLADVDTQETVKAACNLFRTVQVGQSDWKLWKYAKIEARIGRALTPREY
ncbi:hypothetical protein [Saccharopolyspora dendranthemae]|uniref:IacB protein n=1 Tax=Saccharopolyspora dendranthemae TaxID=1181886 RepID=A0A561V8V7_9PSEU|nr:hypothetical protein [Saccharopolyspora dendranthemae]TWG08049.1 hypothetical protein FHU35_11668 [Saccharopolyspora dendranthemae]